MLFSIRRVEEKIRCCLCPCFFWVLLLFGDGREVLGRARGLSINKMEHSWREYLNQPGNVTITPFVGTFPSLPRSCFLVAWLSLLLLRAVCSAVDLVVTGLYEELSLFSRWIMTFHLNDWFRREKSDNASTYWAIGDQIKCVILLS